MLVHDKKHFTMGLVMLIGFTVVLIYMFTPSFGGLNAFEASDKMFNSISKGSTYYIPQVMEGAKEFNGNNVEVNILSGKPEVAEHALTLFEKNGFQAVAQDGALKVSGDLGAIFQAALQDSDSMFKNEGQTVSDKYGMPERQALYVWHAAFAGMDKALKKQKEVQGSRLFARSRGQGRGSGLQLLRNRGSKCWRPCRNADLFPGVLRGLHNVVRLWRVLPFRGIRLADDRRQEKGSVGCSR